MLFENLPFTLLLVVISLGGLDCPALVEGKAAITLIISLATTVLNVFIAVLMTYIESKWLKETTTTYLMTKMTMSVPGYLVHQQNGADSSRTA